MDVSTLFRNHLLGETEIRDPYAELGTPHRISRTRHKEDAESQSSPANRTPI